MSNAVNITLDEARELVSNRLLWPRVRDFLWDFAPQVHESWLDPNQLPLKDSPRVKRYILDSLGVEPCFHAFPEEDGSRILLLDGATLESVAKWLGALASAESLRRVTSGEVVRGLKSTLRGIYPEVFGYTAYFKESDFQRRDAETLSAQSLQTAVVEEGCSLLQSVLADLPSPIVARLKFKLPKGLCASAPLREVKLSTVLRLFKLKFPEAYRLCC
jgi:hypothetical protein